MRQTVRHPISHVVFPVLLALAGCARHSPASADAAARTTRPLSDAGTAPADSRTAASATAPGPDEFVPCRTTWMLPAQADVRVLDGALSGGIAGLLIDHGGAPLVLLVAGGGADTRAVALFDGPPSGTPGAVAFAGPLAGAVTSLGDRFLAAYGHVAPEGLALRARAVMPEGRLLPVAAPGHPEAAGDPVLTTGAPPAGAQPDVLLHAYVAGAVLAVSWTPPGGPGTATVLTATGAPLASGQFGWSLAPAPPGTGFTWLVAPDWADNAAYRYVGPLDAAALALDDAGAPMLVGHVLGPAPFHFADGWVPAAGERTWSAPGELLRLLPGEGAPRAVCYDTRGAVRERVELPEGSAPVALSRDARTLLVRDADGAVSSCAVGGPAVMPRMVDASAALARPGDGASTCGR